MSESDSALFQNYARQQVNFVRGEGVWLYDDHGRAYLDAFAGVAVSALGHSHPALVKAVAEQAAQLMHVSNHYASPLQEALASRLRELAGFDCRAFFCNSGAEATEAALKLSRLWGNGVHGGRKTRVLALEGGFHGRTLGALAFAGNGAYREPFRPLMSAEFLPFGSREAIGVAVTDDVAAVILEVIQGEGGVRSCPPGYLRLLRERCDAVGALLIVDEVQTGIGRTGSMFAFQHEGVVPDVVTLAKGLAGGVPIGAVLAAPAVADLMLPGLHGTTFGGSPLACAAAIVVLDIVEDLLGQVTDVSDALICGLRELFPGVPLQGRGLLLGVPLDVPVADFVVDARTRGLLVGPSGSNTLRLSPPLVITMDEVAMLLDRLQQTISS
jgi:acetylornithine/N-succinyldiaminopimelate aminotransferase